MKNVNAKVAAGVTVIALGGFTGLALSQGGSAPGKPVADKPAVRTKVIRRTIHVTKHAKPKHPPAAAPVEPQAVPVTTGSSGSAGEAAPVTTSSSGSGGESAPVTTASSGSGGGGGEFEDEGGDDHGGGGEIEHEGGDD